MVNEEIVAGLRLALSKGESLKQAMTSFYSAGYSKQEIEDAARALQNPELQFPPQQEFQEQTKEEEKPEAGKFKPLQQIFPRQIPLKPLPVQQPITPYVQTSPQKVSDYSYNTGEKVAIILLIILLGLLLGILGSLFFFKEELINFFNKLLFSPE